MESPIKMLEYCLQTLKGTTPGHDRISYAMVKNAPPALKTRLLTLYNHIFDEGNIPQMWKVANIIPLPKTQ